MHKIEREGKLGSSIVGEQMVVDFRFLASLAPFLFSANAISEKGDCFIMSDALQPRFLATGIGSMPFDDAQYAVDLALSRFPEAPFWPQLSRMGFREQMAPQYAEGLPRLVIDEEAKRLHFDTTGDYSEEMATFYEGYLASLEPDLARGDCSPMAIGGDFAHGLPVLEESLRAEGGKRPFVKVHTTGPCTFALSLTDENKRSIYYNTEFRDVAVKALGMKCRWQIRKFQPFAERVICFLDEPVLSAYGSSAYVGVQREDVVAVLGEVNEAIHGAGALAGVHCCGNTEWTLLTDAGADMISFDAFGFGETIAMYPDAIREHFARGGMLAWGAVPTSSEEIREQSVEALASRLEKMIDNLASKGIVREMIVDRAIITPSCGTGSLEPADAELVFEKTSALSSAMRQAYGF